MLISVAIQITIGRVILWETYEKKALKVSASFLNKKKPMKNLVSDSPSQSLTKRIGGNTNIGIVPTVVG